MPWRLILFVIIFAVFLTFITFNLENRCDISFGFAVLTQVPVFLTVFVSFILGLFCALPLVFRLKKKQAENQFKGGKKSYVDLPVEPPAELIAEEKIKQDAAQAKKRLFSKKHGS
ncbi:MAG: hypothetical protein FWD14_07800 [Treponema sp.]|nr:hypothetical protein [Treponema sp.]